MATPLSCVVGKISAKNGGTFKLEEDARRARDRRELLLREGKKEGKPGEVGGHSPRLSTEVWDT